MTLTIAAMPAFNESHAITDVILGCKKYVDRVIVIDDGSLDNTAEIAQSLGAHVIRHIENLGYGAALNSCFNVARELDADAMVLIDADGQHNPDDIPKLLAPLNQGFDLVIGSRFVNNIGINVPVYRKVGMKVLNFATCVVGEINITDSQSGFRAYGKKAIKKIKLNGNGMSAGSEILLQANDHNLKFTEVGIHCRYDVEKCSSQNPFLHGSSVLFNILKDMEFRKPLYYFSVPGIILNIIGLSICIRFIKYFYSGGSLEIEPMILLVLVILIGNFMVFTGIILHALSKMISQKGWSYG